MVLRKEYLLLVVLIAGIFASLGFVSSAITVVSPTGDTAWTGSVLFNVSFINTTDIPGEPQNITIYLNTSNSAFANLDSGNWTSFPFGNGTPPAGQCTIQNGATAVGSCWVNITINGTFDGIYSVNATIYNKTQGGAVNTWNVSSGIENVTLDSTPPILFPANVSSPLSGRNYSQLLLLNASITDALRGIGSTVSVNSNPNDSWVFFNVTNASAVDNSTFFRAHDESTATVFNVSINTTWWKDGLYNISVYANDSITGNVNSTVWISNVMFDNTIPLINNTNITSPVSFGNYSQNLTLNWTGLDRNLTTTAGVMSGIQTPVMNITNSTGKQNATYMLVDEGEGSWYYSRSINTSHFPDGWYNITVNANDSAGNLNASAGGAAIFEVRFDNTEPSVTLSCSPTTVSSGDIVTCSCSGTDVTSGVKTTTYVANPPTTSTGTISTQCSVEDHAGNSQTVLTSYIVEQGGGGGGGSSGGGGGGGSTSSTASTTTVSSVEKITPETPEVITEISEETGIKEIEVSVKSAVEDVKVTIKKYDARPAAVAKDKPGKVYKYLEIDAENLGDKLDKAKMTIQVEKSWLEDGGLEKEDVAVFKFKNGDWRELETTFVKEEGDNYLYEAVTDSFSFFAIGEKIVEGEEPAPEPEEGTSVLWWIIGIIVMILIVVGWIIYKKKK
tara:strand:- start:69 stop:2084 length:2016 start_codon:yes stop_codon:yes gene_type:complete